MAFWISFQTQPIRTLFIFRELKVWFSSNWKSFSLQIDSTLSFSCKFCNAKFTFRTNRNRHQRNLHPDEIGVPVYRCEHCDFTSRDLLTLEQHLGNQHNQLVQCCLSCYIGFDSADRFPTHIRDQHGLSSRTSETSRRTTETAFQGTLQVFTIDGTEVDQDLMDFVLNNRDITTNFINSEVSNAAKKFSLLCLWISTKKETKMTTKKNL